MRLTEEDRDRRRWMIQSRISWTKPEMADQFEHDMAAGYVSCVAMLGVIVLLTLFVVFWTPPSVARPAWFVLLILLVVLLVPVSWALQRPWIITAHTTEPSEADREYWAGIVHGIIPAREKAHQVAEDLRTRGIPDDGNGPLTRLSH
ncbi:MAG: DUF983 domain-containing protein [Pseudonocardiaceae bacterium]